MTGDNDTRGRPADPVGRLLFTLTRWMAIAGGLVLVGFGLTVVYSIIALQVFSVAVRGEVELVEFGMVITVYLFLPYYQMVGGHVMVDVFTTRAPARVKAVLDAVAIVLFTGIAGLLAWRMSVGGVEMYERGQNTAVIKLAYWWAFPVAVVCFAILVAVCLYCLWRKLKEVAA